MAQSLGTIVCKYGGSSITSLEDIEGIRQISQDDARRKVIVVSAPGVKPQDKGKKEKVTDLLIKQASGEDRFEEIINRYHNLCPTRDMQDISNLLESRLNIKYSSSEEYLASIKAFGEEACAMVVADILGLEYISPRELFILGGNLNDADILPESTDLIRKRLENLSSPVVVPGFYSYTKEGKLATLARDGSNLTGAYLAAALKADVFENFSDTPILRASPDIVNHRHGHPGAIKEATRSEMENLCQAGFKILHHSTFEPLYLGDILTHVRPAIIKNELGKDIGYPREGTWIVRERELSQSPIAGVGYRENSIGYVIVAGEGLKQQPDYYQNFVKSRLNAKGIEIIQHLERSCSHLCFGVPKHQGHDAVRAVYDALF